jgi:hypothetical protein
MRIAEEAIFNRLQEIKASMKPGETRDLPFNVQIHMISEEEAAPTKEECANNKHLAAVAAIKF